MHFFIFVFIFTEQPPRLGGAVTATSASRHGRPRWPRQRDRSSAASLRNFEGPGNFRQLEMVLSNLVTFTLVSLVEDSGAPRSLPSGHAEVRNDVVPFPVKTVVELLKGFSTGTESEDVEADTVDVVVRAHETLNAVSCDVERQYLERLYLRFDGDLDRMAELLLDDADAGRKIQLRMNQLGIRLRVLQRKVRS